MKSEAEQAALVESVRLWICKEANRLAFRYPGRIEKDDLVQEGLISALAAAQKFDPSRGYKFLTYCKRGITWWMDYYIRNNAQTVRVPAHRFFETRLQITSFDAPIRSDDPDGETIGDFLCSDAECVTTELDAVDRVAVLNELLAQLEPRERSILHERFFENRTLAEIGDGFGVCRERIRQLEAQALRRLRMMPELDKLKEAA